MSDSIARLLLEASNDWMWSVDAAGRHVYSNGAIARILGFTHAEIMALDEFTALVHPADRARMQALLERAMRTRGGWTAEVFRWQHKDGSSRWLESNGTPLFDGEGRLTGFAGVDRDITSRMEQERRFRMTFEHAGVGIAHVALDGTWLRVNQPLVELLGYSSDELAHLTFQDLTHPDDLDADTAEAQRLFAGEIRSYTMEKRYIRKDGEVVWATLTGSVVRDDSGAAEYAIAVVRDITAQKNSERDYRTLFESLHDAIVLVDPETMTIVHANPRASELYGYRPEELTGMPMTQIACGGGRGSMERRQESRVSTTHRRSDGALLDVEVTSVRVRYGGREVVLSACRDVSEEKRLVRALAASERRFRSLVEHGYDMIAVADECGTVRFVAGSIGQTLGVLPSELIGAKLGNRIHPDDRAAVAEAFRSVVDDPRRRASVVCRIRTRDGAWRTCEGVGVNMLAVDGVEGVVLVARDITDQRELESRLEQARRVESLGRVAATVAHEFQNVLMGIQPAAELLVRRHAAVPGVGDLARQVIASVGRGKGVATRILRFANPSQPSRQRFEVRPWLARVADELRTILGSRFDLTVDAEEIELEADPEQLHQVVTNLVLNARDAMAGGGAIRISAARVADGTAELAVHDSGPGVAPELRTRVFEPLFTTRRNGTGLGLSLCHQVAIAHGGSIAVGDAEGGGAVFRVRLPLAMARNAA